jgi:hypothetical protein
MCICTSGHFLASVCHINFSVSKMLEYQENCMHGYVGFFFFFNENTWHFSISELKAHRSAMSVCNFLEVHKTLGSIINGILDFKKISVSIGHFLWPPVSPHPCTKPEPGDRGCPRHGTWKKFCDNNRGGLLWKHLDLRKVHWKWFTQIFLKQMPMQNTQERTRERKHRVQKDIEWVPRIKSSFRPT